MLLTVPTYSFIQALIMHSTFLTSQNKDNYNNTHADRYWWHGTTMASQGSSKLSYIRLFVIFMQINSRGNMTFSMAYAESTRRKGWITAYPAQGCRNQENVMHCAHFVRCFSGQRLTPRSVF